MNIKCPQLALGLFFTIIFFTSCTEPRYTGPDAQVQMNWAFDRYGEDIAKKQGLQLLIVGDVTDENHVEYCVAMRSKKNMTYDEARPFAIGLVEDFWQMLHKNPKVQKYLDFSCKALRSHP